MGKAKTYTYQEAAKDLDRSDRTIGRWLNKLKERYPNHGIATPKGRITETGMKLLSKYKTEMESNTDSGDDSKGDAIVSLVENGLATMPAMPDFQEINESVSSRLEQMIKRDRAAAYKLMYCATVEGVGTGLQEGRRDALRDVMEQTELRE